MNYCGPGAFIDGRFVFRGPEAVAILPLRGPLAETRTELATPTALRFDGHALLMITDIDAESATVMQLSEDGTPQRSTFVEFDGDVSKVGAASDKAGHTLIAYESIPDQRTNPDWGILHYRFLTTEAPDPGADAGTDASPGLDAAPPGSDDGGEPSGRSAERPGDGDGGALTTPTGGVIPQIKVSCSSAPGRRSRVDTGLAFLLVAAAAIKRRRSRLS
jgi:hypothetical protein